MKKTIFAAVALLVLLSGTAPGQSSEADRDLRFADRLYDREEWDLAISQYRVFLEKFPSDPRAPVARYRLADALFRKGDIDRAREEFRSLLEVSTDSARRARVLARLGEIAFRKGETAEAQSILSSLLAEELEPEVEESVRFFLAKSHQNAGDLEKATAELQSLLEKFPTGRYAHFATVTLAEIYQEGGKKAEAAAILREFAEHNLEDEDAETRKLAEEALIGAGRLTVEIGNLEEAGRIFHSFAEAFPDSPKVVDALYGEARAYRKTGRTAEALAVLEKLVGALEKHGRTELRISVRFLKATCHFSLEEHDKALEEFRIVLGLEEPPEAAAELHPAAAGQVVQCLFLLGKDQELLEAAEGFEERFSGNEDLQGRLLFFQGQALARQGDHGLAIVEFASLLSGCPDHSLAPAATFQIGRSCLLDGRFERAAKNLLTYVEKYPDTPEAPDALYFAAESYYRMQTEDPEERKKHLAMSAELFGRLVEEYPGSERRETAFIRWAESYVHLGDYDKVESIFSRFLETFPESKNAGEAWYYKGFVLQNRKEYASAIDAYNRLLEEFPGSQYAANGRLRKGLAQYQSGDRKSAVETFLGLVNDPEAANTLDSSIYLWLGKFLVDAGRCPDAIAVYRKAEELFPTMDEVVEVSLYQRGECSRQLDDCIAAKDLYRKLIGLFPDSPYVFSAQYGLGECLVVDREWEQAGDAFAEAMAASSNVVAASATFRLAEALREQEEYDEACTFFMKVAYIYADDNLSPRAYLEMADCLKILGRDKEAEEAWNELIETYPNSPQAAIAREKIGSATQ